MIRINFAEDFMSFLDLMLDLKSPELELELELKSPELELKLIVSSGIGIENNGIGIELKKMELTPTLAAILSWPQCVKSLRLSHAYLLSHYCLR